MEKDFKKKLEASIKEMLNNIEIERFVISEMLKIAETYVKEKSYTLENHLTMIGFAVEVNSYIPKIKNERVRKELDEITEILWNKWYEKVQKYRDEISHLEMLKN